MKVTRTLSAFVHLLSPSKLQKVIDFRNRRRMVAGLSLVALTFLSGRSMGQTQPSTPDGDRVRPNYYAARLAIKSRPAVNQQVELELTATPIIDAPNATVRLLLPKEVALRSGDEQFSVEIKAGDTIKRSFWIEVLQPGTYLIEVRFLNTAAPETNSSYFIFVRSSADDGSTSVNRFLDMPVESSNPMLLQPVEPPRIALPLSMAASSTCPKGQIQISGIVRYTDADTNTKPLRRAAVAIMQRGFLLDSTLASTTTDDNGQYSVCVQISGAQDIYSKFSAQATGIANAQSCSSILGIVSCQTFTQSTASIHVTGTSNVNMGAYALPRSDSWWQAMDNVTTEYIWISQNTRGNQAARGSVNVKFGPNKCQIPSGCSSWSCSDGDNIYLSASGTSAPCGWSTPVVYHEYAHSVMYAKYGNTYPGPPCSKTLQSHYFFSNSCVALALTEGWAEFMEYAVNGNNPNTFANQHAAGCSLPPDNIQENLWWEGENCDPKNDGTINEGAAASILWAIYNHSIPANGSLDLGFDNSQGSIWDTILTRPISISEFRTNWLADFGHRTDLDNIYSHHGIPEANVTAFHINNGAASTTSQAVTLNNTATGNPTHYMANESSTFNAASWLTYSTAPTYTLTSNSGSHTVYFKVKNGFGESSPVNASITLNSAVSVISVTPSSQSYGSVAVGSYKDLPFTVQNTGGGTLSGSVSGFSAPFSVVSDSSYSLGAGAQKTITVRFKPTAATYSSQNLTFTGGGGATRNVNGTGTTFPNISVTPGSQAYGSVIVGSHKDLPFTVQNTGNGTLSGSATASAGFSFVGDSSYSLSAGSQKTITVRFSPTAAQPYNGTVSFTGGGGTSRPVTGTGTQTTAVYLNPASTTCHGSSPEIDLSFSVSGGTETTFDLYRNGALISPSNTGTTFKNYGSLTAGQSYSYYVLVHFSGGGSATSNSVNAIAPSNCATPGISVTPGSQAYGSVAVSSYKDLTFTVQNTGSGTLSGNASASAGFSFVGDSSYSLSAGSQKTITVRFSPTAAQPYNGTVSFTGGGGTSRPVTGTGTQTTTVYLNPASTTCHGSSPEIDLSFSVSGGTETTFDLYRNGALVSPSNTGTTFKNYGSLTAGQSYSYYVLVHFSGGGTATSNSVNAIAPSNCTTPTISVTPGSRQFGSVAVGSYADSTFIVQNTGSGTLSGSATANPPFSFPYGGSYNLAAGAQQSITVRFRPTVATYYSQNVNFSGGNGTSASVTGTGTQATAAYLTATTTCRGSTPEIDLSFSVSGGIETTFDLYRNGALVSPSNTGTTFQNYGSLTAGQSYSYYVLVHFSGGGTATSNTVYATAPSNCSVPLSITSNGFSPSTATVGTGYSAQQTMAATGGTQPYSWSISGQPNGMAMNSSYGALYGTPTSAGTFYINVTVRDSGNPQQVASKTLTLTVANGGCGQTFCPGDIVTVYGSGGLNLRSCASTSCSVLTVMPDGTPMQVLGGPTVSGGITWWYLSGYPKGAYAAGWASGAYLRK